jgi:hypothetical protein
MPIIEGGGGTDFVKWWADENKKNGYQTVSMNTTRGIQRRGFVARRLAVRRREAPKMMIMPVATVDASNLEEYAGGLNAPKQTVKAFLTSSSAMADQISQPSKVQLR